MKELDYNADITVYPEAHHSFDREGPVVKIDHAYSMEECRLIVDDQGVTRTKDYGFPMSTPLLQKIALYFCAKRGSELGGNTLAREKSAVFALDFMKLHLKR